MQHSDGTWSSKNGNGPITNTSFTSYRLLTNDNIFLSSFIIQIIMNMVLLVDLMTIQIVILYFLQETENNKMKKSKLLLTLLICTMMLSACSSQKSAEQSSDTQSISETQSSAESRNDQSVIDLNSENTSQKSIEESKGSSKQTSAKPSEVSKEASAQTSEKESENPISTPESSLIDSSSESSDVETGDGKHKEKVEFVKLDEFSDKFNGVNSYDNLIYQSCLKAGVAQPDMRKITESELLDILRKVEFKDDIMKKVADDKFAWNEDYIRFDNCVSNGVIEDTEAAEKVFASIKNIQYFPDAVSIQVHCLYFWPDTDYMESVRTELCYDYNYMTLVRYNYSEEGDLISTECLYSYPYELEKAAIEKYGCSEEREARRLFDVYEPKKYSYTVDPPETDEKLAGEQVVVPEDKVPMFVSKEARDKIKELREKRLEYGYGVNSVFDYQEKLAYGRAYPNMRKITVDEVREIFEKAAAKGLPDLNYASMDYDDLGTLYRWMDENIIKEIMKIQYYPDAHDYISNYFCYWPDADTVDERRQEIRIYTSLGKARLLNYDEEGNRINSEIIYDLIDNR